MLLCPSPRFVLTSSPMNSCYADISVFCCSSWNSSITGLYDLSRQVEIFDWVFFSSPPVQQGSCCWIFSPPSKLKHCRGSSWPWEINMGGLALLWGSPIEATSPPNPQLKGIPLPLRWKRNSTVNQAFTWGYPTLSRHTTFHSNYLIRWVFFAAGWCWWCMEF